MWVCMCVGGCVCHSCNYVFVQQELYVNCVYYVKTCNYQLLTVFRFGSEVIGDYMQFIYQIVICVCVCEKFVGVCMYVRSLCTLVI